MILHVLAVEYRGGHRLHLQFNDGESKTVDLLPLLRGPVFEPLRDPREFARVRLDAECGKVVWPSGADLAPMALGALRALPELAA